MDKVLSNREQALLSLYRAWLPLQEPEVIDVRVGEAIVKVARIRIPTTQGGALWFVGTLGDAHSDNHLHQFIGVYESNDISLCELMASLFDYDVHESRLLDGHTVPLGERSGLRKYGYGGALITTPAIHGPLAGIEKPARELKTTLFAVIPLTDRELTLKRERGLEALHGLWRDTSRDLLVIDQKDDVRWGR